MAGFSLDCIPNTDQMVVIAPGALGNPDTLVGPNTVNTLPPHTLEALQDHGMAARTIDLDVDEGYGLIERLGTVGIDMKQVTDQLLADGVRLFAESFEKMLADIEAKRAKFAR